MVLLAGSLVGCANDDDRLAEIGPARPEPPGEVVTARPELVAEDVGRVLEVSVASVDRPSVVYLAGDSSLPVEARLLVMSANGSEPEFTAIRTVLDYRGVPYDVFVATAEPALNSSRLASGEHGFYQGIILTSSSLSSTLSASEWTALASYEQSFAIRRAVLAAWPDPALGFGSYSTVNSSNTTVAVRCTTAGRAVFRDVNCDAAQKLDGDNVYLTSAATSALTPLLTDASNRPLAVVHTGADERETLLLLYRNDINRLHTLQYLHGVIGWVTGGTFLGERRIEVGAQLDDFFFGDGSTRLDDDDLSAAVAWMNARGDFRLAHAFNGQGAADGDPLTEYTRSHSSEFWWINHTWSHFTLDEADYATAHEEFQRNIDFAEDFPLLGFDVRDLVTGNYSGLSNPQVMQAATDVGIRFAVMDTSKDGCDNPSPNTTFYNAVAPSLLFVPRRPTNLFWNVATPTAWVAAYNAAFRDHWGRDSTYAQVINQESDVLVRYLMRGEADPWMFHQANLNAYDGDHSMLGDLLDATLTKLAARLDVPVTTPPMHENAARFARRVNYEGAGVRATLYRGRALVIDTGRAVSVPVTGVRPADGESYGGDEIALVDVVPGTSTCVPLDDDGDGCTPSPGRTGGAGPVTPLPIGYCYDDVGPPPPSGTTVIARGSDWRYWDRGTDLGTAWRARNYNDSAWAHGAGPLGYGESYIATTVSYGPSSSSKYVTTYFRRTFDLADPAAVTALTGSVRYDDGFVVYLNGTEIGRAAMPSGTITYATLSSGNEATAYVDFDWTAKRHLLVAGSNTLAVEVHQSSRSSSDLVFDLGLTMQTSAPPPPPPPPPTTVGGVPRNASWWYWDNGGDLGTAWRTQAGGVGWDSGAGAFGYGESYLTTTVSYGPDASNKYVTTYFTTTFSVDDPAEVTAMLGDVMYDDGFVAYLNGFEIGRAAMPSGAITASTLSSGFETGNNYAAFDWTASRNRLVAGTNVLAVEVHQAWRDSSDLTFDLGLTLESDGEPPPPPPPPPPVNEGGIPRHASWSYWDNGGDLGTAWRTQSGGAGWDSGPGALGYGEGYLATTVSYGPDAAHVYTTTYFTTTFSIDAPAAVTSLLAEVMYDDGFVAYLNGVEIGRGSMPAGAVTAATHGLDHEADNRYVAFDWSASRNRLVAGTNILAVEVHQAYWNSSDLVFDLSLTAGN